MYHNIKQQIYNKNIMFRSTNIIHAKMPKLVSEVMTLIKSRGHTCCMFDTRGGKLDWCNKDECEDVLKRKDMDTRQKKTRRIRRRIN